jgi:hypothetical protein
LGVGPEFIAKAGRDEIEAEEAKTLFMEQGRPGERDHCESFDLKFRDELLNDEIFHLLLKPALWLRHGASHTAQFDRTCSWVTASRARGPPLGAKARDVISPSAPALAQRPIMH